MLVSIEKLDHQGRGITRINNKITFIENALPNEEVEIEIVKEDKKFNEAIVKKIIKKSPDRVEPQCPYYDECGGCNLMHLAYEKQLEYKEQKEKEIMEKYAGLDAKLVKKIVASPSQFNYRNKASLKYKNGLGYYKRRTNDIVKIEGCLLLEDALNEKIDEIKNDLNSNVTDLILRNFNNDISLTLSLQKGEKNYNKYQKMSDKFTICIKNDIINATRESNIFARLDKFDFKISPTAFFQVNTRQTINLYNKIREEVKKDKCDLLLDLYCGTGTIGIYVSDYVSRLVGVEINPKAIEDAKINVKNNGIKNAQFYAGDTKFILSKNKFNPDIVVVDPPRSGLDKEVVSDLIKINSKKIIYVSCDPITLARDLNMLKEFYDVLEITPFDMFPQTYHCESVVILERK